MFKLLRPVLKYLKYLIAWICLGLPAAWAQSVSAVPDVGVALLASAQSWLDHALAQQAQPLPLRTEVVVGRLDARLKLAPCQQIEPYLPPGTRLWGQSRLGLRCVQGVTRWNVFLPITVKAFGPAWVIKGQIASGAVLQASDAMAVEVDWAERASPVIANQADWLGQTATRMLGAGQPLRQDMVRGTQVFQAGTQVRVVASGTGFEITGRGQALSGGVLGQSARVRMGNGQILQGQVTDDRTVRVLL
ncbi:MAG: flagellar basal body P-ring formation chaperone FlgA [Rhodoferax sp.]|nr:flagellar basal body P-ring formation chaperone FlgA [Rhodoferax sp.]